MNHTRIGTLIAAAALLTLAGPAQAQREAVHDGFWISFGFGAGTAFGDDAFDGDSKFGGAGFLRSYSNSYLAGEEDFYVPPGLIKMHSMRAGSEIQGSFPSAGIPAENASMPLTSVRLAGFVSVKSGPSITS